MFDILVRVDDAMLSLCLWPLSCYFGKFMFGDDLRCGLCGDPLP